MDPSNKSSNKLRKNSNSDSDALTDQSKGVKQPLLGKNDSKSHPKGKIDKKKWLRTDSENCIENFLFFGMSRVKHLVGLPEVSRDNYLNIRNKDKNSTLTAEFEKLFLERKKKGKHSFSGAYYSFVTS